MEYVRGMDLGRLGKLIPTLSVEETCEIGRQIALGLSYAHAQGLVHRDIKPSNVILDDVGVVKILDFGLVLFDRWDGVSSELTTVGQFLGTLDYMAPEQAERCGSVDYRADLYALGATMFKLLCGRAPLAAAPNQSPIDKLRLLATHRPPSLKTVCPDAPDSLIRLVDSLLSTIGRSDAMGNGLQSCAQVLFRNIETMVLTKFDSSSISIRSALASLESKMRKAAMQAWIELPDELDEKRIDTRSFNRQDFRLEDKFLSQLQTTMTDERRREVDDLSVAYVLHSYASFLLLKEMPPANATPVEIGEKIAEISKLDTNHDWLLGVDEQPTEFKQSIGKNQAMSFGKY